MNLFDLCIILMEVTGFLASLEDWAQFNKNKEVNKTIRTKGLSFLIFNLKDKSFKFIKHEGNLYKKQLLFTLGAGFINNASRGTLNF